MKKYGMVKLNLRLFDGEAPAAAAPAPAIAPASATAAPAQAAAEPSKAPIIHPRRQAMMDKTSPAAPAPAVTTPAPSTNPSVQATPLKDVAAEREAEFERLISGDFKDPYDKRLQATIDRRFKETKAQEGQYKALEEKQNKAQSLFDMLGAMHGVDGSNIDAIAKAIENDERYWNDLAVEKGLTVPEVKEQFKKDTELRQLRAMVGEQQKKQQADQTYAKWHQQAEATKAKYPKFDIASELNNPKPTQNGRSTMGNDFTSLLYNNINVQHAYEVVHMDEIMGGAMAYTAQQVQQKTVADIQARGTRPVENGVSGHAPAQIMPQDLSRLTPEEKRQAHKNINKQVARGVPFTFGR